MLMLSRLNMIWTMPDSRCHFQIKAIQMKLRWRWGEKIDLLPSECCITVEVDPTWHQGNYYAIQNGLGLKIVKNLKPFGPYPSGHGTTSRAPCRQLHVSVKHFLLHLLHLPTLTTMAAENTFPWASSCLSIQSTWTNSKQSHGSELPPQPSWSFAQLDVLMDRRSSILGLCPRKRWLSSRQMKAGMTKDIQHWK